jgi:nucleotide-binding universal stress UspA family protein
MFENILIPISSEFYSKNVLKRSAFFAEKFNSTINLIYIIEEKTLDQADKRLGPYRTSLEKAETKKEMINKRKQAADNIIFEDAKFLLKDKNVPFEEKIVEGEFSDAVIRELSLKNYDLILMGFEKECILNYRLLDNINIPIWIEGMGETQKILAVCSNLAPNQKVPDISIQLSKMLGWDLQMLYIVDIEDSVQVNEQGIRSDKKPERDLLFIGQKFVDEWNKKGTKAQLVEGSLERETIKAAEKFNPNLVIVGREQKKKGILGLPVKHLKRKIAEKCEYSILFIN